MAISDQTGQRIYKEIDWTAMPRMFDLRDILELIDDGFDDGPFAQQDLIIQQHEAVLHVLAQLGDQLKIVHLSELVHQRLRDVASIAKQLAPQVPGHVRHRFSIVDIARPEMAGQQLTAIIDDQMQFEAIEPAHRSLAAGGQIDEDPMGMDAAIVTNGQGSRIDKGDPAALAE